MEKESFGETFNNFPKIDGKENSTYYKTFYSGNQNRKHQTISAKLSSNSINDLIRRNRAVSSFSKYKSQLPNHINNNKKRKFTSLVKTKNSFSSAEFRN